MGNFKKYEALLSLWKDMGFPIRPANIFFAEPTDVEIENLINQTLKWVKLDSKVEEGLQLYYTNELELLLK